MPIDLSPEEAAQSLIAYNRAMRRRIDSSTGNAMGRAIQKTSRYPAPLPNQKYVRTGIYGTTFTMRRLASGKFEGTSNAIQSGKGYSGEVGGGELAREQGTIHHGRWPLFLEEVLNESVELGRELTKASHEEAFNVGLR